MENGEFVDLFSQPWNSKFQASSSSAPSSSAASSSARNSVHHPNQGVPGDEAANGGYAAAAAAATAAAAAAAAAAMAVAPKLTTRLMQAPPNGPVPNPSPSGGYASTKHFLAHFPSAPSGKLATSGSLSGTGGRSLFTATPNPQQHNSQLGLAAAAATDLRDINLGPLRNTNSSSGGAPTTSSSSSSSSSSSTSNTNTTSTSTSSSASSCMSSGGGQHPNGGFVSRESREFPKLSHRLLQPLNPGVDQPPPQPSLGGTMQSSSAAMMRGAESQLEQMEREQQARLDQDYSTFCSTLSAVATMAAASLAMEEDDLADSTTPPPTPFSSSSLMAQAQAAGGLAGNGNGSGGGGSVEGDLGPNGELLGLNGHQHEKKTPNSIRVCTSTTMTSFVTIDKET
ncbi:hypothetical protein ZHAS_00012809 [Anopheles sinensis]|uniref:Uncharacterized protein n=1 Tax=Anopheles sinensis TaxID=74873 RepID=A0A084W3V4_ANOSI|nr:hypothetical protein ZHAS_00012809 [Anopheles sinensis]